MNQERFKALARKAGFEPEPTEQDLAEQLTLARLVRFYAVVCEDCAQAAAAVFGGDMTRITHDDAVRRSVLAIRSLYTNDVMFQLADPTYDMGRYDTPVQTRKDKK